MKKILLKARCLCSGVKFTTSGNHRDVQNCHCVQCMKTHGHHAAYTKVEEQNVKFTKKNTLKWFRSSKMAKRGFCSKCGASIFFKVIGTKDICIAAGMFNGPTKLKTTIDIFTKNRLDYYKLNKDLKRFNLYPNKT